MKKSLLLASMILAFASAFSQCWVLPRIEKQIEVSGDLKNSNYEGDCQFNGSATFENSVNFNKWNTLVFNGSFNVNQTLNMKGNNKIYINGSSVFNNVNFSGGDTLFVKGSIVINKAISNNSNKGKENVIMISEESSLIVDGKQYNNGDVIKGNGNESKNIYVYSCQQITLPVKISMFYKVDNLIIWQAESDDQVDFYTLQGSNDHGKTWKDIENFHVNDDGYYAYNLSTGKTGKSLVFAAVILGIAIVPGRKRKALGIGVLLLAASFQSCSKKDIETPSKNKFELYRVAVYNLDGTFFYTKTIH